MAVKFDLNCKKNNFKKYEHVNSRLIIDFCEDFEPDISIMIPTFKRPHLIKETIDSAIRQKTEAKFEVVIIDNDAAGECSEELEAILSGYENENVRYFRNEVNIGMFGNWNRCIELARADHITILNDDDLLSPDWLENVYFNINGRSLIKVEVNTIYQRNNRVFDLCNDRACTFVDFDIYDLFFQNINPGSLGLLLNKEACLSLGGFREELYPTADYDFLIRYVYNFGGRGLSLALAGYYMAENESLNLETMKGFIHNDFMMKNQIFVNSLNSAVRRFVVKWSIVFIYIRTSVSIHDKVNKFDFKDMHNTPNIVNSWSLLRFITSRYPNGLVKRVSSFALRK